MIQELYSLRRRTKVQCLQKGKQPKSSVSAGLLETSHGSSAFLQTNGIPLHAVMGQLTLAFAQPPSGERVIGQHEQCYNPYCDSHHTCGVSHTPQLCKGPIRDSPRIMNNHLQPAMPWTSPKVANVAAAINPANDVAKMFAEYKIDILVAISLLV